MLSEQRVEALIQSAAPQAKEGPPVDNNCRGCIHSRDVPGNCHIKCVKPDPNMTGHPHGIRNGWFMYPLLYDPTWMTSKCENYEPISRAVESSDKSE